MTISEQTSRVFSVFHDGIIESCEGESTLLTIKIDCSYLAERINPAFNYFYIDLFNVQNFHFDTWEEDVNRLSDRSDILKVFNAGLCIGSAENTNDIIKIHCSQPNPSLDYTGGVICFTCNHNKVYNENKVEISLEQLELICDSYWDEFHSK